jgi:hypothetical protein
VLTATQSLDKNLSILNTALQAAKDRAHGLLSLSEQLIEITNDSGGQTRDMGGSRHILMKDLSAPINVKGRHWGGLRLAYKFRRMDRASNLGKRASKCIIRARNVAAVAQLVEQLIRNQ